MQLNALIGKKIYQKQGFLQDGTRVPLSGVIVAGNVVTQIKTQANEGYNSLQLGVEAKKKANKAIKMHVKKALDQTSPKKTSEDEKTTPIKELNPKYFREVRVDDTEGAVLGSQIDVSEVFAPGDIVDVTGVSKGKGWAGGVKRYHFKGGPRTHGQSDRERAPGSIGQTTTPGRVYKGKKMAGRMGTDTVTVKNLEVIEITDDGVLLVKGLVPGSVNGFLLVKKTGENKKFVPLYREIEEKENGDGPLSVSDDVNEAEEAAGSKTHSSDDAQRDSAESSTEEPASLSGNQSTAPEIKTELGEGLVSDSPQNGSGSNVQETVSKQTAVDSSDKGQTNITSNKTEDAETPGKNEDKDVQKGEDK